MSMQLKIRELCIIIKTCWRTLLEGTSRWKNVTRRSTRRITQLIMVDDRYSRRGTDPYLDVAPYIFAKYTVKAVMSPVRKLCIHKCQHTQFLHTHTRIITFMYNNNIYKIYTLYYVHV